MPRNLFLVLVSLSPSLGWQFLRTDRIFPVDTRTTSRFLVLALDPKIRQKKSESRSGGIKYRLYAPIIVHIVPDRAHSAKKKKNDDQTWTAVQGPKRRRRTRGTHLTGKFQQFAIANNVIVMCAIDIIYYHSSSTTGYISDPRSICLGGQSAARRPATKECKRWRRRKEWTRK